MANLLVSHEAWQRKVNGQFEDLKELYGLMSAYFVYYFWLIENAESREAQETEREQEAA